MTHKMSDLDRVISTLEGLTRAELIRLRIVIDTYLAEGCLEFESPGDLDYKYITRGVKRFGPYRYRRTWVNGKLTSRYEGKAKPGEYEAWLSARGK